jgi:hypothetical protein
MRHYRQRRAILIAARAVIGSLARGGRRCSGGRLLELEYPGLGRGGDRYGRLDTAALDFEVGERFWRRWRREVEGLRRSAIMGATVFAPGCAAEREAMPLRYAAELVGMATTNAKAIR